LVHSMQDSQEYAIVAKHPVLTKDFDRAHPRGDLDPLNLASISPSATPPRFRRLNAPISLLVFYTNLCQTDCRYCYAERKPIPRSDWLQHHEWREIIEQAHHLKIKKFELTGGDTFARRDGIEFVELLLEYNMLFLISTKCFIPLEYADRLVKAGFCTPVNGVAREFQYSLDSGDSRVAGFLTRRSNFLERTEASIKNLVEVGISPKVKAVLTSYNTQGLDLLVERMIPLEVKKVNFTFYEESFYWHSEDLSLSTQQRDRVAAILSTFPARYPEIEFDGNAVGQVQQGEERTGVENWQRTRAGCSGGRTSLGITADGKAVLCEQTPQGSPFVFGDLRKQSILEIWNSDALIDFVFPSRDKFVGTVCYDCHDFEHCQYELGNCFRDAFFATGNPFNAPPSCPRQERLPRVGNWRAYYFYCMSGLY
jgi:radical SAM protein with 4Fe4S-binding SPASM domain